MGPGTKLRYIVPWKNAQNDLHDFETNSVNIKIMKEIKQKLEKHGEIFSQRSIYDQQDKDKHALQLAKKSAPKSEAYKKMMEIHERAKAREMEMRRRKKFEKEAVQAKKSNEVLSGAELKMLAKLKKNIEPNAVQINPKKDTKISNGVLSHHELGSKKIKKISLARAEN